MILNNQNNMRWDTNNQNKMNQDNKQTVYKVSSVYESKTWKTKKDLIRTYLYL